MENDYVARGRHPLASLIVNLDMGQFPAYLPNKPMEAAEL